ncbi:TLC domain-containing protein [Kalaharituber pfeilii]|nr:TLC domain-containing protein [Kalaharituber pfeilii]
MPEPIFPPWPPLTRLVGPFAERFNLNTLPLHIHEVLIAFITYHVIFLLSPLYSSLLFPRHYPVLKPRTRINWDVHVVSLVQSTFISGLALYVMWVDKARSEEEHRVFGYTPLGGQVQAFALGYFVWDLAMSAAYFDVFGIGFLMHALSAVFVFSLGFRPFVNYYGPIFVLFELSSPLLNFHWFFDKLHMTGSRYQLYNGIALISTFFLCRIVWGPIQSYRVFRDVWDAYNNPPMTRQEGIPVPGWLGIAYLGSNGLLNCLNYYWFGRMIDTVRKRFEKKPGEKVEVEKVVVEGTEVEVPPVEELVASVGGREKKKDL